MTLWLLHHESGVVQLKWGEDPEVEDLQPCVHELVFRRLEDAWRRLCHVLRPRFHHEVPDAARPQPHDVLEEDSSLISLGDVLIEHVHHSHTASVRLRFRGVPEDGHQVCPSLGKTEQVPERAGGNFDRGDHSAAADVGDVAGRGAVSRAQIEDGGVFTEPPDAPPALQIRGELAPVRVPSSIFDPSFPGKTFAVDGSPRDTIPCEQPRPVREHALPLRWPDRHRWTDGTTCNEASEIATRRVYEGGSSVAGAVFRRTVRATSFGVFGVFFRGRRRDLVGTPSRLLPPTASGSFGRSFRT